MFAIVFFALFAVAFLVVAGAAFESGDQGTAAVSLVVGLFMLATFGAGVYDNYRENAECPEGISPGEYEVQIVSEREDGSVVLLQHSGAGDDLATDCRVVDKKKFVEEPDYSTDTVTVRVVEGGNYKDIEILN